MNPHSQTQLDAVIGAAIRLLFRSHLPRVLDGGAGAGKFPRLYSSWVASVDGVEHDRKHVDEYDLRAKYGELHCADIRDWTSGTLSGYDLLLLSEVLEYLPVSDARDLVERARRVGVLVLAQVNFRPDDPEAFWRASGSDGVRAVFGDILELAATEQLGVYLLA